MDSAADPTDLLTTSEVAKLGRVSRATVIRWYEAGDLPAVQIGRIRRFRRDHVEQILTPKIAADLKSVTKSTPSPRNTEPARHDNQRDSAA